MVGDNTYLFGGIGKPGIRVSEYLSHSNNRLLVPVPNEVLWVAHSKPQVVVKANGIASVCEGCDVELNE